MEYGVSRRAVALVSSMTIRTNASSSRFCSKNPKCAFANAKALKRRCVYWTDLVSTYTSAGHGCEARRRDEWRFSGDSSQTALPDMNVIVTSGQSRPQYLPEDMKFMLKPRRAVDVLCEAERSIAA